MKRLLGHPRLYNALQKGLGADRLRYRGIDTLAITAGERVLDIGCGPAFYFDHLPAVRYYGFDTDERYIEFARRRWGNRGEFRCEVFSEAHLTQLPQFDKVLLFGLLHHLSDAQSRSLLSLVARAIVPSGTVLSIDTCYEPGQGRISRWISDNDRGEYVRPTGKFVNLARESFSAVEGEVLADVTRIPGSFWMMKMNAPRLA